MNSLDPSYLRYIYDGIFNGVIASDNESTLPEGLVGLYEDAFLENIPVYRRQQTIVLFACWALLKKEASILFVSEILQFDENEVFELVGTYSSWFNSPESGKYSLYHERLRIYFLQKLNENEIQYINQRLIARLQKAIADQDRDEFEIYALQFLSDHLLVEAFADESKGKELFAFTKNENIWNRQIKVSNQFTWAKNTIQKTILWTSKYQPKESVFGYLDLVELHHKEQNDAENIVALVANNEIELALKRIESFGGGDKVGLQRKFILYMLCLMELTLLESKTQPWRKEAIEKILNHFDEQMPIDYSILNWNDFFPSYLVFQMACEFADLELDYLIIYKRTDNWTSDWIEEKSPFSELQFDVLINCSNIILIDFDKNKVIKLISIELVRQWKSKKALEIVRSLNDDLEKINILAIISSEFFKQGLIQEVFLTLQESLNFAKNISDYLIRSRALKSISYELAKQEKFELSIECSKDINDDWEKSRALIAISNELAINGQFEKAIEVTNYLKKDEWKSEVLMKIAIVLAKQIKIEESFEYVQNIYSEEIKNEAIISISFELAKMGEIEESIKFYPYLRSHTDQSFLLMTIANKLAEIGKIEESIELIGKIEFELDKSFALVIIAIRLKKLGEMERSLFAIKESLEFIESSIVDDEIETRHTITSISKEFAKEGYIEESLKFISVLNDDSGYVFEIRNILSELALKSKFQEIKLILLENLKKAQNINSDWKKTLLIKSICCEKVKNGDLNEFNLFTQSIKGINYIHWEGKILNAISIELAKQSRYKESLNYSRKIRDGYWRADALLSMSNEMAKRCCFEESLECGRELESSVGDDSRWVIGISKELIKQNKNELALEYARNIINNELNKCKTFIVISNEIHLKGEKEKANLVIKEILEYIRSLSDGMDKCMAIIAISKELTLQGNSIESYSVIKETLEFVRNLSNISDKCMALTVISIELAFHGNLFEAEFVMKEVNEYVHNINDSYNKNRILIDISNEFAKQGEIKLALLYTKKLNSDDWKSYSLKDITIELSKQNNLILSESISIEIQLKNEFQSCWREIAKNEIEEKGAVLALETLSHLQNEEVRKYYLKGWVENVTINDLTEELLLQALPLVKDDSESIEHLLQTHAINELFFENVMHEEIQRYNEVLNIQWAMDIKSQLLKNDNQA